MNNIQKTKSIFVTQVKPATTWEELYDYFSQYGNIVEVNLRKNKGKGRASTGEILVNNFLTYNKILRKQKHRLRSGETIVTKKFLTGNSLLESEFDLSSRKISVFNIRGKLERKRINEKLQEFGEIESSYFLSYEDNPKKAYGFVTYYDKLSAKKALKKKYITINGRSAELKRFKMKSKSFKKALKSKKARYSKERNNKTRTKTTQGEQELSSSREEIINYDSHLKKSFRHQKREFDYSKNRARYPNSSNYPTSFQHKVSWREPKIQDKNNRTSYVQQSQCIYQMIKPINPQYRVPLDKIRKIQRSSNFTYSNHTENNLKFNLKKN